MEERKMADTQRFPRMRIQEDDFPFKLPDNLNEIFLEVVDSDGDVLALFCLVDGIENQVFQTLDEFAHYYDELFFKHRDDDDWAPKTNIDGCAYPHCVTPKSIIYKDLDTTPLIKGLSAYGRLRYPFGSENKRLWKIWEGFLSVRFLEDLLRYVLSEQYEKYQDDLVEIFHFIFDYWGVSGTHNRLRKIFSRSIVNEGLLFVIATSAFVKLDLVIIESLAGVLFAEDNIDFFIQAAVRANNKFLEDYLQEFKRKYIGFKLNGFPRFRFLEKDFPEKFPPGANSSLVIIDHNGNVLREPNPFYIDSPFFIEFINDAGETIALFHICEDFRSICWWWHKPNLNLPWFPDKLAFTRYFDEISSVKWGQEKDESYYDILMDINSDYIEDYETKMREHKVSSKQEYCDLAGITDVGGDIQPLSTSDTDIFIDYGRLKYPYLLDEYTRAIYISKLEEDIFELFLEIKDNTEEEYDEDEKEKVDILQNPVDAAQ
jgi:hypothetical protein